MRLLILCETFPPEVDAKASRFSEFIPLWQQAGIDVTLITRAPNFPTGVLYPGFSNRWKNVSDFHGAKIIRAWSILGPNAGFLRRIVGFVSYAAMAIWHGVWLPKPDVILATSPSLFAAMGGGVLAMLRRSKFVFEVRDLWPEAILAVGAMQEGWVIRIFKKIAKILYHRADAITTVGEGYKQQIVDWYGIAPGKIHLMPGGVLAEQFTPKQSQAEARKQLGLPQQGFFALYIGTHGHAHRLDVVLRAAQLLKNHPHITFLFVGEGAEKAALKALAAQLGVADRCVFVDQQPKAAVPMWYDAADIALVLLKDDPLFRGTVPSKLYEAMAMQKPVLCNVAGVCSEMIEQAGAGITIPPENPQALADAVLQLAESRDSAEIGTCARAFVLQHYDRHVIAEHYAALLKGLVVRG